MTQTILVHEPDKRNDNKLTKVFLLSYFDILECKMYEDMDMH